MSLVDEYLSAMSDLERARVARAPLSDEEECEHIEKLGEIWDALSDQDRETVELALRAAP